MKTTEITLESTAQVLIRCFWMGLAFQVLWFFGFLAGGDWGYEFHQPLWSGLTRHEYDLANLYFLGFFKLCVFGGFLLPYLAIRMVLRRQGSDSQEGKPT